jgi:cytochrome b subunit of formate dehydrogenase
MKYIVEQIVFDAECAALYLCLIVSGMSVHYGTLSLSFIILILYIFIFRLARIVGVWVETLAKYSRGLFLVRWVFTNVVVILIVVDAIESSILFTCFKGQTNNL